jgi:hypothetical protein
MSLPLLAASTRPGLLVKSTCLVRGSLSRMRRSVSLPPTLMRFKAFSAFAADASTKCATRITPFSPFSKSTETLSAVFSVTVAVTISPPWTLFQTSTWSSSIGSPLLQLTFISCALASKERMRVVIVWPIRKCLSGCWTYPSLISATGNQARTLPKYWTTAPLGLRLTTVPFDSISGSNLL